MTQQEYDIWITKMKLLGEMEQLRKNEERSNPDGLKQFLIFLDEIHQMWRKNKSPLVEDMSVTNLRITRQQLLARFPIL